MTPLPPQPSDDIIRNIAPIRVTVGPVQWDARSPSVTEAIRDFMQAPELFLAQQDAVIHRTWLVTVARVVLPKLPGGPWLLRRSNYAKSSARMRDIFRTASPVRAFQHALNLERAGLPTPRVLAAGVIRKWRIPRAGYLLMAEVPQAVSLAKLAESRAGATRAAIQAVAGVIARMHERGFIHGDLTINNVLLDGAGQPWLIDLERARRMRGAVNWRLAVEDFHRFARHFGKFSAAGKRGALRLLKVYCMARGWAGREREFAGAIFQRVRHKVAEDRKG